MADKVQVVSPTGEVIEVETDAQEDSWELDGIDNIPVITQEREPGIMENFSQGALNAVPGAISGLLGLGGQYVDNLKGNDPLSALTKTGMGVGSAMGWKGALRAGAEGLSAIPALAFGGPFAIPSTAATTGTAVDVLTGAIPTEGVEDEWARRMGEYNTLGIFPDMAAKGVNKAAPIATDGINFIDKKVAKFKNDRAKIRKEDADLGVADARALKFPGSKANRDQVLAEEIREAAPYVGDTGLWDGGDVFNTETLKFEKSSPDVPVTPRKIQQNLKNAITKISQTIEDSVDNLDRAAASLNKAVQTGSEVGYILPEQLNLSKLRELAVRLNKTFSSRASSEVISDVLNNIDTDFELYGRPGKKVPLKDPFDYLLAPDKEGVFTIRDVHDTLKNVYRTQRALKAYDVRKAASGAENPGDIAKFGAEKEALDAYADSLRKILAEKTSEIVAASKDRGNIRFGKKFPLTESVMKVQKYSPNIISDLKEAFHKLKPFEDYGLPDFIDGIEATINRADSPLPDRLGIGQAVVAGSQKLASKVFPPDIVAAKKGQAGITALQDATRLRAQDLTLDVPSNRTPINIKLPRKVGDIFAITMGNMPENLSKVGLEQVINNLKHSPSSIRYQGISQFLKDNPDIAEEHFEAPPVKGYRSMVKHDDGNWYMHDEDEKSAYREQLMTEEKDLLNSGLNQKDKDEAVKLFTRKQQALNSGRVLIGGAVDLNIQSVPSSPNGTESIKTQKTASGATRQKEEF